VKNGRGEDAEKASSARKQGRSSAMIRMGYCNHVT